MMLAAIYNVWDGEELLIASMKSIEAHIDLFVIVYQNVSNFGEPHCPLTPEIKEFFADNKKQVITYDYAPGILGGIINEKAKRQIGIDIAMDWGATHFLHMDCDEFFEDFGKSKKEYEDGGHSGSVCSIFTYFKKPTWRLENLDGYFVPFIHKLNKDTKCGMSSYSFYVDPTRGINDSDIVALTTPMHHFSWVRHNIERKVRNSSAGQHGNKLSGLLNDYNSLNDNSDPTGFVIKDMGGQRLIVVPDIFGLDSIFLATKRG